MNKLTGFLLMGAIAGLLSTQALANSPRASIEAAYGQFADAILSGQAQKAAEFYAEDASLLPHDAPRLDDRAAIVAYWQAAVDAKASDLSINIREVETAGDYAFESGEASFTIQSTEGTPVKETIKYLAIWKKTANGEWRIYRDIWNSSNPAP
jgi:uncharacterized protein (TIGR02246 family)